MKLAEIQIRDPFILPVKEKGLYYLFGSTDKNVWNGPGTGFDCYRSRDLLEWEGPVAAFRPQSDFWATTQFWAPEVYYFDQRYFMLATFKAEGRCRGTQVLVSSSPQGPFEPLSNGPVTPSDWECLDGTLYIDQESRPWIVFCHEWLQIHDGAIYAMRLTDDLQRAIGEPSLLFHASQAPWVRRINGGQELPGHYVTDGPCIYKSTDGSLLMLWSSFGAAGYAMGLASSPSGSLHGPWLHQHEPLVANDGGHGMLFRSFDGRLFLTFHQPNVTPNERAIIREIAEPSAYSPALMSQPENLDALAAGIDDLLAAAADRTLAVRPAAAPVRRLGLALEPTPGLLDWAVSEELDAVFLHRHWHLELAGWPEEIGVLANHDAFDRRLGIGDNPELLCALGLQIKERLGGPEILGIVGEGAGRTTDQLRDVLANLFGGVESELAAAGLGLITKAALARAMTPELIARAAQLGSQVYITGQLRQRACKAALEAGLFVFAIGHRRSEQWALRLLGTLLSKRWPELQIVRSPDCVD